MGKQRIRAIWFKCLPFSHRLTKRTDERSTKFLIAPTLAFNSVQMHGLFSLLKMRALSQPGKSQLTSIMFCLE
ncbi:hypothetical protein BURKHO8Y_30221 [Burkholderia sp. 8Y]|nr:hypothetical protein BURKHO8Y_30221 [Burkholderia sp. 8Y]